MIFSGRFVACSETPIRSFTAIVSLAGSNPSTLTLPDVRGRDLWSYNLGASVIYAVTPSFNLLVECTANFDEDVDDLGSRDRSVSVLLSPGFRYGINFKNDAQMVVGIAAPIGLTRDAPDYGVFFYFSFEHAFHREERAVSLSK